MKYRNDSVFGSAMSGWTAGFGFSELSKPGSVNVTLKFTDCASLMLVSDVTGTASVGATLFTVIWNVRSTKSTPAVPVTNLVGSEKAPMLSSATRIVTVYVPSSAYVYELCMNWAVVSTPGEPPTRPATLSIETGIAPRPSPQSIVEATNVSLSGSPNAGVVGLFGLSKPGSANPTPRPASVNDWPSFTFRLAMPVNDGATLFTIT